MAPGKKSGGKDWKTGQSGNPNGRPKSGMSLTDAMKDFMETKAGNRGRTLKDDFINKVYQLALQGNVAAVKLIWNHIDGMPQQKVDHTTGGKEMFPPDVAKTILKEYEQQGFSSSKPSEG